MHGSMTDGALLENPSSPHLAYHSTPSSTLSGGCPPHVPPAGSAHTVARGAFQVRQKRLPSQLAPSLLGPRGPRKMSYHPAQRPEMYAPHTGTRTSHWILESLMWGLEKHCGLKSELGGGGILLGPRLVSGR